MIDASAAKRSPRGVHRMTAKWGNWLIRLDSLLPNKRTSCQGVAKCCRSAAEFATDELFDGIPGGGVVVLLGRRLHEVGGRREQRPADAPVQGDLGGADRVDDHAGGVRRVPDL